MIKADKKGGLHMAKTSQPKGIYKYGSLKIDQPKHEVSICGNLIELRVTGGPFCFILVRMALRE